MCIRDSHYDVWTNFKADPLEILMLYNYKKDVLQYQFHPFIWDVGGKYVWPVDRDKIQYHYRRGFEDCFTDEMCIRDRIHNVKNKEEIIGYCL